MRTLSAPDRTRHCSKEALMKTHSGTSWKINSRTGQATRVCQITDLHIPGGDQQASFGHVKAHVMRQLDYVRRERPDLLVISGDLTIPDACRPACEWLCDQFPAKIPTIVLPGNHDSPATLWEVFGPDRCGNQRFYYKRNLGEYDLVVLNTHTDHLPREQMDFLQTAVTERPAVLFMHHPPDLISDGFMARQQPLANHQQAAQAIRQSRVTDVFCGHYHNTAEIDCNGFQLHLTPSPAFQVSLLAHEFEPEAFEPCVRNIVIGPFGVRTSLATV
jgi:Icc protein